jgi:hypothetical protein
MDRHPLALSQRITRAATVDLPLPPLPEMAMVIDMVKFPVKCLWYFQFDGHG